MTVTTRPRPDYDPLGVRLPGFRLDAALESGPGFDDNTTPEANRRRSAAFLGETAELRLSSTFTRHALNLFASQDTRQYAGDGDRSWIDHTVGFNGRYDIGRASSVGFEYRHLRGHLDTTDFDVQTGSLTRPLPFESDIVRLTGVGAFNRLTLDGALDYRTVRYEEKGTAVVPTGYADFSDHDVLVGEGRLTYSLLPGRSLSLLSRLTDISYRRADQRGRDSFTWEVLGGVQYDLTGLWAARIEVGYRQRDYEDPSLARLSGPAFEGQITYMPSQLVTIALTGQRTIEESIRAQSVSYTRTAAKLGVDYELRRNVILSAELTGEQREYTRPRDTVSDAILLLSGRLLLNRSATLIGSYQYVRRLEAADGFEEYDRNLVQLRLRFAL
ncbi:outer membrane beta-barrel protein [Muricoccus radiodurans]|uniref:outer membrane beta-barrel protein n=1 Tax=Muricoccus radiodurans TaxID=2231721 RepID=UPI003CF6727D